MTSYPRVSTRPHMQRPRLRPPRRPRARLGRSLRLHGKPPRGLHAFRERFETSRRGEKAALHSLLHIRPPCAGSPIWSVRRYVRDTGLTREGPGLHADTDDYRRPSTTPGLTRSPSRRLRPRAGKRIQRRLFIIATRKLWTVREDSRGGEGRSRRERLEVSGPGPRRRSS